jgi:hypothetical protein
MKVFDLACQHNHRFEGWFASAEQFDLQRESGMVLCPACGNAAIKKLLSAPRLNLGAKPDTHSTSDLLAAPQIAPLPPNEQALQLQQMWISAAKRIVESTEHVGDRFAEEARRIHYREAPERNIRGSATAEQARELIDEGIDVFSFPLPESLKEPLQ